MAADKPEVFEVRKFKSWQTKQNIFSQCQQYLQKDTSYLRIRGQYNHISKNFNMSTALLEDKRFIDRVIIITGAGGMKFELLIS